MDYELLGYVDININGIDGYSSFDDEGDGRYFAYDCNDTCVLIYTDESNSLEQMVITE